MVVDRRRERGRRGSSGGRDDAVEAIGVGHRLPKFDIDAREAAGLHEEAKRVRMQRTHMGQVADIRFEKRHPARGVDRLEHQRRTRPQFLIRELEHARQIGRLEMLDDLDRDETAEACIRPGLREKSRRPPVRRRGHARGTLRPSPGWCRCRGADAVLSKQFEQFAAAAADIDDVVCRCEQRQVRTRDAHECWPVVPRKRSSKPRYTAEPRSSRRYRAAPRGEPCLAPFRPARRLDARP